MNQTLTSSRSERGQSMVELALSFVLLLILLSGVIDLGRAFFAFIAMRDAAQEGAIYASIYPVDGSGNMNIAEIVNRVRNNSTMPVNLNNPDINVAVTLIGARLCHGNGVRVRLTWDNFPLIFPFWGTLFWGSNTIPIAAQVEDTILRPPCK